MDYNKVNKLTREAQSIVKNMKSQLKESTKWHVERFAKKDIKSFPSLFYAIDSFFDEYIADLKYIKVMAVESLAKEQKKFLLNTKKNKKRKQNRLCLNCKK